MSSGHVWSGPVGVTAMETKLELRDVIHFRKVSIKDAAREIGISRQYLSRAIHGGAVGKIAAFRISAWVGDGRIDPMTLMFPKSTAKTRK